MTRRHSHCSMLVVLALAIGTLSRAEDLNRFDCASLSTEEAVVDGGLYMVQSFLEEFGDQAIFDDE